MNGNNGRTTKVTILSDLLLELLERKEDEVAFSVPEIAQMVVGGSGRMAKIAEGWVFDLLPRARQRLERLHGLTFVPVTGYYFEHWYGVAPPTGMEEARKCVAGLGNNGYGKTCGLRKIWIGSKDDAMAFLWLNQGFKSGANKWRKVADRLLTGYATGDMSKKMAAKMLQASYSLLLPENAELFERLLPKPKLLK